MCFTQTRIRGRTRFRWEGDRIEHECIVRSARPAVGFRRGHEYDIDVRELLASAKDEVMRRTLREDVQALVRDVPGAWDLFRSRRPGSFDHRADVIHAFVAATIRYAYTPGRDPWQFPAETLALRSGDCEDRALLIASLLLASGISPYNVRVALGRVRLRAASGRLAHRDHAWVMYKDEDGHWTPLDPTIARDHDATSLPGPLPFTPIVDVEYQPELLFNDAHLWRVQASGRSRRRAAVPLRQEWSTLDPSFAGEVHASIVEEALGAPETRCPTWVTLALGRRFQTLLGNIVDPLDADILDYDPRDHFDDGYVEEGWDRVKSHLDAVRAGDPLRLDRFARAAHAIADFYAHTSYVHFARVEGGVPVLYDPSKPTDGLDGAIAYTEASGYAAAPGRPFTVNPRYWPSSRGDPLESWKGRLLSGRYALRGDARSWFERLTQVPSELSRARDFFRRGGLPHHDEIAVDEPTPPSTHLLYRAGGGAPHSYEVQFARRRAAAVAHVRRAFVESWR